VHPDTGSGNPAAATAAKGREYFEAITTALADLLVELSAADPAALAAEPNSRARAAPRGLS
jgi:creatinine amidohydrolase